ncbi:MAG: hypothetical protein Q8K59_11035 [Nitrosomonas sp.]|nr:hypothetical protein [Nitrosomonas sp.]MDP1951605.1 hypothetical protein [Nitrosomonas sp.]
MTKRGKQASRKAAARKYGFLEVPIKTHFRCILVFQVNDSRAQRRYIATYFSSYHPCNGCKW